MNKSRTRLIALTILFFFLFSLASLFHTCQTNAKSVNEEEVYQSVQQTIASLLEARDPNADIQDYEWLALDLIRSEQEIPSDFSTNLINMIIEKNGILHTNNYDYTNYAKAVLVLTSLGIDATNVAGYNLIERISIFPLVASQGVNGVIYALLALDSANYEVIPPDYLPSTVTRNNYINSIINSQLDDGGWDWANKQADPDITAMAIQALAPYYNSNENVKAAVDKALQTLSHLQQPDGGFNTEDAQYKESSESTSMVILALTALGIDPAEDDRFIKNGLSTIDNLCSFAVDGGFKHTLDGKVNLLATDQGYRALVAYHRLKEGTTSFYNMSDIGALRTVFTDVLNPKAWYYDTVYSIAATKNTKGHALMSGYSNGSGNFGPADPLTRQDFAVVLYRLANEQEVPEMDNPFADAQEDGYYYGSVLWAKANNVIAGYNDGRFGVGDQITREQVATILYRFASDYLKLDTSEASAAGDLSKFNDGTAISDWAETALTWATGAGVITGKSGGTEIAARGNAARAEIGAMILRFINYKEGLESSSSK